jgi:hypothetical protein
MRVRIAAVAAAAVAAVAGTAAGSARASVCPPAPAPPQALPMAVIAPLLGSSYGPEDGDLLEGAPPAALSGNFDGPIGD